jgi:hypothetical protein
LIFILKVGMFGWFCQRNGAKGNLGTASGHLAMISGKWDNYYTGEWKKEARFFCGLLKN